VSSVLRSTRVATELRAVPVERVAAPVPAAIPVSVPIPVPLPLPAALTYEEYKQRYITELADLRQQVFDSSREQGLQQGRAAVEVQLETLRDIIESARDARLRYIEDIGDDAAEVVFVAVAKILGDDFATQDAVVAAVREALRRVVDRTRVVVRVAPLDFELLSNRFRVLLEGASGAAELVADENVELGGCLVESSAGNLDARLETQMQRLREALVRARTKWGESDA
jgi:flagellar assembly protein FliH